MRQQADLVLEGGGVKGIALLGAVQRLMEDGYRFSRVAGSSAGAIVGALVAAGLPPERMGAILRSLDYRKVLDKGWLDRIPLVGAGLSVLLESGVYEGEYVREWLGNELAGLGVETFADLRYDDPDADSTLAADHKYRFVATVADVTRSEMLRFPWDYRRVFGLDPDQQRVADAVRASMSIPFVFEPVELRDVRSGLTSTLVDGGVLSNFPVDTFDRRDGRPPRWPTFGVKLAPDLPVGQSRIFPLARWPRPKPLTLLESLVTTLIVGHDQTRLADPCVARRLIRVDTGAFSFLDFGLSEPQQDELARNGREAAADFLQQWNWADYLASACGGRPANP